MRPAVAILRAVARAMRRDAGSFFALKVNNFFLFVLLPVGGNLSAGLPPRSAYPFLLLLGFLLLFPLSSDPFAKVPSVRLAAWPLTGSHRAMLRLASIALSPVFWIAAILFLRTALSLGFAFLALAAAMQVVLTLVNLRFYTDGSGISLFLGYLGKSFPGKLGPLITVALRQIFSILDTYVALLISIGGCIYRFAYVAPDPAAYPIFSLLIALALSTHAQCLFGLDSPSVWTRYRLLPLTEREITLPKDAAFLGVLFLLTLPLSPLAGMSFALVALCAGRLSAMMHCTAQPRWRFTGGRFVIGVFQVTLGSALGLAAAERSAAFGVIPLIGYIFSTSIFTIARK